MAGLFLNSQDSDESQHIEAYTSSFSGSTNQITHLTDVFSSITTISPQALMIIKPTGISIYAEYNHISNVQLNLDPSLFNSYSFLVRDENDRVVGEDEAGDQELRLGIDISLISDAFQSVTQYKPKPGKSTNAEAINCYFTYKGDGHPLVIEFEDDLMSEKLEFLTFYVDISYPYDKEDDGELVINYNEVQFELILKSDVFTNLLADLHQINTLDLFICISNEIKTLGKNRRATNQSRIKFTDNQLNFISKGPIGHLKLIYPSEKTILEKLLIYGKNSNDDMSPINTSLISCYNFANFFHIYKAVRLSSKCKIIKDLNGVLSIQLLCMNSNLVSYAGTLITFNMLEVSGIDDDDFSTLIDPQTKRINNIFDDESYQYAKPEDLEGYEVLGDPPAPSLLYSAFRKQPDVEVSDSMYDSNQNKNRKPDKDDGINTVGGAIEVPLFM